MDVANTLRDKHILEKSNLPFENKPHNSSAVFSFAIFRILHIVKRVWILPPTIMKNLLCHDFYLFCYDSDDKRANKYKPNIYQRWKHSCVYMLTLRHDFWATLSWRLPSHQRATGTWVWKWKFGSSVSALIKSPKPTAYAVSSEWYAVSARLVRVVYKKQLFVSLGCITNVINW